MPPPKIPLPSDEEILDKAREVAGKGGTSLGAIGRALGIKGNTFIAKVNDQRPDLRVKLDAVLATRRRGEPQQVDDPQRVKLDQQAAEIKALRKENQLYADEVASRQTFLEQIAETVKRPVKLRELKVKPQSKGLPKRSVITPIFDCQYGQRVIPEDTPGGRGTYSTAIFDANLARWFEGVTGSIRDYATSHKLTELVIPLGGDFVEGHGIFRGQEWQLEKDPPRQVWEFAQKLGGDEIDGIPGALPQLIQFAREEIGIPKVRIYVVPGNHGKVGGRQAGAIHSTHSWDWLVGMLLRDKLRAQSINEYVIEPGGALYFGSAEHIFLMIHGDEIKGWGGIPFYGLARQDAKSIRQGHIIHDYMLLGDKHRPAELGQPGGSEMLMSGAWIGDNNLSRELGGSGRPEQRVYYVASKWGITESARIPFQSADEARQPSVIHG